VSAASQFARSRRALVSRPGTRQKSQLAVQMEQIKITCTFWPFLSAASPSSLLFLPPARVLKLEEKTED